MACTRYTSCLCDIRLIDNSSPPLPPRQHSQSLALQSLSGRGHYSSLYLENPESLSHCRLQETGIGIDDPGLVCTCPVCSPWRPWLPSVPVRDTGSSRKPRLHTGAHCILPRTLDAVILSCSSALVLTLHTQPPAADITHRNRAKSRSLPFCMPRWTSSGLVAACFRHL